MSPSQAIDLRRDRLQALAENIRQEIREVPTLAALADHVEIEITQEGLRIELLEDSSGVFFESGSAIPKAAGAVVLQFLGKQLGGMPNGVVVEGHTDARPYHRADGYTNWELSVDRANAARRIMLSGGLSEAQVQQVRGWADRKLRDPEEPFADANRRVTVTMLLPTTAARFLGDSLATAPDSTRPSAGPDSAHIVAGAE